MKVLLDRNVPNIDMPTTQPGSAPPATMNPRAVPLRLASEIPNTTTADQVGDEDDEIGAGSQRSPLAVLLGARVV